MRTRLILLFIVTVVASAVCAQEPTRYRLYDSSPRFAVKSNLLYDLTAIPNLGIEAKLSPRYTLDLSVNYNPFTYTENRKWKHILVQPEVRYWLCESFLGHFFGLHMHYANYNVGNIGPLKATREHRYRGWLAGAGISYGYHQMISDRWSLEATLGLGYAYLDYDKYECPKCGEFIKSDKLNYFGPTKVGISLIYVIK